MYQGVEREVPCVPQHGHSSPTVVREEDELHRPCFWADSVNLTP